MNPLEFALAVVAIIFGARLVRDFLRHQRAIHPGPPSEDTRLLVEEVARLRDRVQVLERVVTDNHDSLDLGSRIEQLRDR